jgi:hypothetical protein
MTNVKTAESRSAGDVAAGLACPIRKVGLEGTGHHFFGYYNKTNWDRSGKLLLAQQVPWATADLTPDLTAKVGYFDLEHGDRFHVVGQTTAWNWQMGSQLQWLDGGARGRIIFNTRAAKPGGSGHVFGSTIVDIHSGRETQMPLPVYVVAPSGRYALCVDYRRLYITHQTIGYAEPGGPFNVPNAPGDDGVHWMDLETGERRLILSFRQLREFHAKPSMDKAIHWVSHIEINPASSRILLLHRWTERVADETCFLHRLITLNPDGSDVRLLECSDHPLPQLQDDFVPGAAGTFDYEKSEYQISHPLWKNDRQIIVWSPHAGSIHYHLYDDEADGAVEVIGDGVLVENGHMTFSPVDERWLLTDTYPDDRTNQRTLLLFDMETGRRHDLGRFYTDPDLGKENRCDLHPRWRGDGRAVCIDSVHEGERQMYLIDVAGVTGT